MSTFKNNLDAMFAKIFPAAAEAAQEDHGGFNIGDLAVILLDLVLLIYTGYRSWHFLSGSVTDEFQILAIVGLWGLDIGMVFWSVTWMFGSTTKFQNWTSMGMFVIDLTGVFLTSIVDTLAYGNKEALPPVMQSLAWYGIPIIIGLNVLAGFVYHMTSPSTRKRRAMRAQDEEMSKQKEKGDLELRRMNLQLTQAQDYTNKRASMLVSFADIAEQNIAMSEIEAIMMARLNQAASGQLSSLMGATRLALPSFNPLQTEQKSGVIDKLNELKNKFMPKSNNQPVQQPEVAGASEPVSIPGAAPEPTLNLPVPVDETVKGNGHSPDPQ